MGTIIRLILMPIIAHPFDVYAWYRDPRWILRNGLTYTRPLWDLTLVACSYIHNFTSPILGLRPIPVKSLPPELNPGWGATYIPGPLFNVIIKTPMLLADTLSALLLYQLIRQHMRNRKLAEEIAVLYYLNPIVIWISAAWGQYDSIPTFFSLLSLYLLLQERIFTSAFSLLIATAYKTYPIALAVPTMIYFVKRRKYAELMRYLIPISIPLSALLIRSPRFIIDFLTRLLLPKPFHGIFGFGLTYWSISLLIPLDPETYAPVSLAIGLILFLVSLITFIKLSYEDRLKDLTTSYFILVSSFFLFLRYPFEQRSLLLLMLLSLLVAQGLAPRGMYAFLSIIAFLYAQKTFPSYLLPIAAINQDILRPLFHSTAPLRRLKEGGAIMPAPISAFILATLGIAFSVVLAFIYVNLLRKALTHE